MAHFFILTISALLMIVTVADGIKPQRALSYNVATHVVIFPIGGD